MLVLRLISGYEDTIKKELTKCVFVGYRNEDLMERYKECIHGNKRRIRELKNR